MGRMSFRDWVFVLAGGAIIPVLMVIAVLTAGDDLPGEALVVMLGVYGTVMVMTIMMARMGGERSKVEVPGVAHEGSTGSVTEPVLELMDFVEPPVMPVTVGVARTAGICPLGFRPGRSWVVGVDGRITPPLCRPAAEVLSSTLQSFSCEELVREVSCRCPLGDCEIVFEVVTERA